jgi:hypothetical protein
VGFSRGLAIGGSLTHGSISRQEEIVIETGNVWNLGR